jgi:hypothetical protein
MSKTTKTTVYLDDADYRSLKGIAKKQGRTTAMVVREAIAQYVVAQSVTTRPTSLGAGRSRRHDLSERAEQLLSGLGRGE